MKHTIQAACGCHIGKIRKNNEDNFCFEGKCLEQDNNGLKHAVGLEEPLKREMCFAVFDGMGGENFGEAAAYAAARRMQQVERTLADFFIPEKKFLLRLTDQLNQAVLTAKEEHCTDKMGTTLAALYFTPRSVYVCNVGDSRAYRLRNGEFLQLSVDHVERRPGREYKKAPLTQHLGMDPEEVQIEPHIAKGELQKGDVYILCSDGLTDMLTNFEISDTILNSSDPEDCVQALIRAALEHGGRDNITVIVCKII